MPPMEDKDLEAITLLDSTKCSSVREKRTQDINPYRMHNIDPANPMKKCCTSLMDTTEFMDITTSVNAMDKERHSIKSADGTQARVDHRIREINVMDTKLSTSRDRVDVLLRHSITIIIWFWVSVTDLSQQHLIDPAPL
jgi:hypothetical protein